jgi:hypothetical protein
MRITVINLIFCITLLSANDGHELLREIFEEYDSLHTYEFEGTQVLALSADCDIEFPLQIAHSGNAQLSPTVLFHSPRLSPGCADKIKSIVPLKSPVSWADFNTIDAGVSQIRELPQQILHLPHQEVRCMILELQYDEYNQKIRGLSGPIRYWVDVDSHLIRRAEFQEASPHGTQSWIVTI